MLWKIFESLSIKASDGALAEDIKQRMSDDLKNRYTDTGVLSMLDCATYLDVRFKNTFVADSDKVKLALLDDLSNISADNSESLASDYRNPECSSEEPPVKREKSSTGLHHLLANIRSEKQQATSLNQNPPSDNPLSVAMQLQNEFLLYDEVPEADVYSSPLVWWSQNSGRFKHLSALAKKYLCVAATSVASERVVSTSGNIVSAKRNRTDPELVDQLTFLAKNLDLADTL